VWLVIAAFSPTMVVSPSITAGAATAPATAPPRPSSTSTPTSTTEGATSTATASALTMGDAKDCPVTRPGTAPADIGRDLFGWGMAFGNSDLWVGGLGVDGVITAGSQFVESDGSIGWKLGWYRLLPGDLTITGRRLDAPAPPLRASVPDGYGTIHFQASGVWFPTEGCWQVTGHLGRSELTFVTFVVPA
jgi:hypothetical protein